MLNKGEKKVKNATTVDKYGIHFKSALEVYTYEAFMKAGIPLEYEPKHFSLLPAFEYNGATKWLGEWTTNRKGKKVRSNTIGTYMEDPKVKPITYCPDFIGKDFVIECKGFANESFPLRFKLFKHFLQQNGSNCKIYVVKNHAQVDELIKVLNVRNNE